MLGFIGLLIVCKFVAVQFHNLLALHRSYSLGELAFHTWLKVHMRKEKRWERENVDEYRTRGLLA